MCDENADVKEVNQDDGSLQIKSTDEIQAQTDSTPCFKLNIDCLYEIFDYLSLEDVQSFGRTCKPLQQLAGEYFTQNYVTEAFVDPKDIEYPGIPMRLTDFNKFVQNLLFSGTPGTRSLKKVSLYAAHNYNHKLKRIRFYDVDLTGAEIRNFQNTWQHLESLVIEDCIVNQKFYDQFPKVCSNLKRLYIKDFRCRRNVLRRTGNEWLLFKYQHLEHFHWTQPENRRKINELNNFFKINPGVRSFTIDIESLWTNKEAFMELQLNDLTIEIFNSNYDESPDFKHIYKLLNELHAQGVYKRLHINLRYFNQGTIDQMIPLYALRSLCLNHNTSSSPSVALSHWMNLVEVKVSSFIYLLHDALEADQLVNLKRASFNCIELRSALKFLCHSVKLEKFKIKSFGVEGGIQILDLAAINKEREKLQEASKVTVYLFERAYLATKWAMNGLDFSLIEIRRSTSDEWGHNFIPFY